MKYISRSCTRHKSSLFAPYLLIICCLRADTFAHPTTDGLFFRQRSKTTTTTTAATTTTSPKGSTNSIMTPTTPKQSARFNTDFILCEDLRKPDGPILTGIGFFDHMIDQFNSHAQIGITLTIANFGTDADNQDDENGANQAVIDTNGNGHHHDPEVVNRHAEQDQSKLMSLVGTKLGKEFQRLVTAATPSVGTVSRFCCPLDEALVECIITNRRRSAEQGNHEGTLSSFTLAPYGKFPRTGRTRIGMMETKALQYFWENLAIHSGLDIQLNKLRGDNAHHIVESTFKAFSRAFRNLLDGVDTTATTTNTDPSLALEQLYGPTSSNWNEGIAQARRGSVKRQTKETSIEVDLKLDGGKDGIHINTGIQMLDEFFTILAASACMSLTLQCKGDLWIDEHHTAEDVAIAMGQVLTQALGTKAGLNRMWCATATYGDSRIEVTMDLSNRPCFKHNLSLDVGGDTNGGVEKAHDLSLEMFEHVLDSLVVNARLTVHIVELQSATCPEDLPNTVRATARAFGTALKYCCMVDSRRCGATASSKGTLSV